jgi:hypothetical protein
MKHSSRRNFLDRYPIDLTPTRDGAWRCALNAISATGDTPRHAVDALHALCTAPIARVPISLPRWLNAR